MCERREKGVFMLKLMASSASYGKAYQVSWGFLPIVYVETAFSPVYALKLIYSMSLDVGQH